MVDFSVKSFSQSAQAYKSAPVNPAERTTPVQGNSERNSWNGIERRRLHNRRNRQAKQTPIVEFRQGRDRRKGAGLNITV